MVAKIFLPKGDFFSCIFTRLGGAFFSPIDFAKPPPPHSPGHKYGMLPKLLALNIELFTL